MNGADAARGSGKPELIVGLVGAAGTDLGQASRAIADALAPYGYEVESIRLSALMQEVNGGESLRAIKHEEERIQRHMDAGDAIRDQAGRNDAIAGLAIGSIFDHRRKHYDLSPAPNRAFLLNSLKHPDEISTLRRVYRDRFVLISVHSPTGARLEALKRRLAASHDAPQRSDRYQDNAEEIMRRDEHDEERSYGQNVRDAFTQGDVYVSVDPLVELEHGVKRFFRLFFGDPFQTPTPDEYAMFQTHAAALRSADLSRQVGATICTDTGEIVAVGCNEVPKAFGGQYWPGDNPDRRDFELGYDSNVKYRQEAFRCAFQRLRDTGQLTPGSDLRSFTTALDGTRLGSLTEFGRTMHAEMAALLDAARRGAAVEGHRLFTTTFPCHNCARHIIGAGLREVVYLEPYEKSLASELHNDSVVVDPAEQARDKLVIRRFVGIGPTRYHDLFAMPERKDGAGMKVHWSEGEASPRLVTTETAYLNNEEEFLDEFRPAINRVDLGGGGEDEGNAA